MRDGEEEDNKMRVTKEQLDEPAVLMTVPLPTEHWTTGGVVRCSMIWFS